MGTIRSRRWTRREYEGLISTCRGAHAPLALGGRSRPEPDASIMPLATPAGTVAVADLLP
jgi:hypothetical protein